MKIFKINELNEKLLKNLVLYHGTQNRFKKFEPSYINTRWGQAYGYGFYLTDSYETAETYSGCGIVLKVKVKDGKFLSYKGITSSELRKITYSFFKYYTQEREYGKEAYPTEELRKMCWNEECKYLLESQDGGDVYGTIASMLGNDEETSNFLHRLGYIGIQYPITNTGNGKKFNNYVIFNAEDIEVIE